MSESVKNLPCYVETVPGIEEVAWLEIRDRLPDPEFGAFLFAKDECGIVTFRIDVPPAELLSLRTVEGVFLSGAQMEKISRGYGDLNRLEEVMAETGDFGRAVNALTRHRQRQIATYRLEVRKYGRHEYSRSQFRQAVIANVESLYPRWERVQKNAGVEIWANVLGSSILIGLRVPMPQRPASVGVLRSSMAAALALLSDPQAEEVFVDPFCGSGLILEARAAHAPGLIVGGDLVVAEAIEGSRGEGIDGLLVQWDAKALPLATGSVDKVATNFPPVPREDVAQRYRGWLAELQRALSPGGLLVLLTSEHELFKDVIRDVRGLEIRSGYSVTVAGQWGRIYLLRRVSG